MDKCESNPNSRLELGIVLRGTVVWLLIITAECLNGAIRELVLVSWIGDTRARQVSFAVALIVIVSIAAMFIRWIGALSKFQLLLIGGLWAILTVSFEFVLGSVILGQPLVRFVSDYDISKGGFMSIGLIFLVFVPLLVNGLREDSF